MKPLRPVLVAAVMLALSACATPPAKLHRPVLRDDVPLAGIPTSPHAGWPDAQWWKAYADPQLDRLIVLAMQQAPDLAVARARLASAEQNVRNAAAQAGLTVGGNAQFQRQRISDHGLFPAKFLGFNWYNQADLGVQLDYDFDFWGAKKSAVEAALDQAHAAAAERSAAAIALQNAVAATYFGWQADQARLRLADTAVQTQQHVARLDALRVRQGVDQPDELAQDQAQLAALRQSQTTLASSAKIRLAALAALLGIAPAALPALEIRPLPEPAQGLPSQAHLDLIARRPDIAASRWQVESALRQTDVARAAFFPDVSISALAGLSSIDMGKLLTGGSRVFDVGPAIHLPIFSGGRLQAAYGISRAQLDSAVAQYNQTVINAANQVASQTLSAEQLAARRREQDGQLAADRSLLAKARARFAQGTTDARPNLDATLQLLQQQDAAVSLHAQALDTELNLIQALGGGYRADRGPDAAPAPTSSPFTPGAADHERD